MYTTTDLRLFVHTAGTGSLSRAARNLGMQPATASASLKRLEQRLDCRLFERSTRNMRLTQQGEIFLQYCRNALMLLDEGEAVLSTDRETIHGHLRLTAPSDLGRNVLLPWFNAFQQTHPQVTLTLQCSDRFTDLFRDPIDIAFRYGKLEDSSLVSQHLADNRRVVVASPDYLKRHGRPATLQELADHNCLLHNLDQALVNTWRFQAGRVPVEIKVHGDRMADDGGIVREWAVAGWGIAYKSWLDVRADVRAGRLVTILDELTGDDWPLSVIYPHRTSVSPAARGLMAFVRCRLETEASL